MAAKGETFDRFSLKLLSSLRQTVQPEFKLGETEVITSVKAELGKPRALHPDKGKVAIFVDCSPTAAPVFEGRGGEELSTELSVAQRCLLGGKSGARAGIDLSSLVIVDGKICWDLYVDGLVVSSEGNLLDDLVVAIKVALSDTGISKVTVDIAASQDDQPEVNGDYLETCMAHWLPCNMEHAGRCT